MDSSLDQPDDSERGHEKESSSQVDEGRDRCRLTIAAISDDVLINIFILHRQDLNRSRSFDATWPWHTLVHVCQRWRHIVFTWPHHLGVGVVCKSEAAVARALDVWPALPISIQFGLDLEHEDDDGIITALEQRDRIAGINLSSIIGSQLEPYTSLMQDPFPVLRRLSLCCWLGSPLVIPDAFLGGSTPHLQSLKLCNVMLPTSRRLLFSSSGLVDLYLEHTSATDCFSPDVIANCLIVMTRLRCIAIVFQSSGLPHRTNRRPPLKRTIHPTLTEFVFQGVREYLEDLVAQFDAPRLGLLALEFYYQPIFDIAQLSHFIHRIEKFKTPLEANLDFHLQDILISIHPSVGGNLDLEFMCTGLDKQLSLLEQIYSQCLPLLSHVNKLKVSKDYNGFPRQDSAHWSAFLRPFDAVEILSVYGDELEVDIVHVLGKLTGERAAELLPKMHTLVFRRSDHPRPWWPLFLTPILKPFIDARQQSNHPLVVLGIP